jgi:hypothetical protein
MDKKFEKKYIKLKKKYTNIKKEFKKIKKERDDVMKIIKAKTINNEIGHGNVTSLNIDKLRGNAKTQNISHKPYFKFGKLPPNRRRPSMHEAILSKQVAWFGVHKIDNRLLTQYSFKGFDHESVMEKLYLSLSSIRGEIVKKKKLINYTQSRSSKLNQYDKDKLVKELNNLIMTKTTILSTINNMV